MKEAGTARGFVGYVVFEQIGGLKHVVIVAPCGL